MVRLQWGLVFGDTTRYGYPHTLETAMTATAKDLQHWLERATSLGAAGAEILVTERTGTRIQVENGRVVGQSAIHEDTVQVTAFVEGGGMGRAVGVTSDGGSTVASAVAAASDAPSDPKAGPVRGLRSLDFAELGIDDRRWSHIELSDRIDVVINAERNARIDKRVHTHPFAWTDSRTHRMFASTADVVVEQHATRFRCEGGVRVAGDDAVIALTDFLDARSFATVSSIPFGANMAKRALALLDGRMTVTGPIRVMLAPRATALLFSAMAEALVGGDTFLHQPNVALHKRIHLLDDGALAGGLRTNAFDDRGVPPVPVVVLRKGRLDQTYQTPGAARGGDARATGHYFDGVLRPNNLILRGGTRSINAVLSERSDVTTLVVEDVAGVDAINWKTGDVDLIGYGVVRNGNQIHGSAAGVRLRGNLAEILAQMVDVTSDTDRMGHIDASGMLVDGFVAG